jgi:hypothetical protein
MDIFWNPIFLEEEATIIQNKIFEHVKNKTGKSINDALSILKGMTLKCHALVTVIDKLVQFNRE